MLVVPGLSLGGTERQVTMLASGLADEGHDVLVVVLFDDGPNAETLRARGIEVRGPLSRSSRTGPLLALLRMIALLRDVRPEVVHAFLFGACVITGPAALIARIPVRVAGRRSLGDWKQGRRGVRVLERITNPAFTAFVANAEAVALDAIHGERIQPARMRTIRNALSPESFGVLLAPADHPETRVPVPRILCVANLIGYKGHSYLIDALKRLHDVGHPAGLLLVGDGPERRALGDQAGSLPVAFLGARNDVRALLGVADVVVLPSLHEGMSNALMEAMAQGRACVATDVGGNREVLGDAGLLCPPADSGALALALGTVLADAGLRDDLGRRAHARARSEFALSRLVEEHVTLYGELLAEAGRAGGRKGVIP